MKSFLSEIQCFYRSKRVREHKKICYHFFILKKVVFIPVYLIANQNQLTLFRRTP